MNSREFNLGIHVFDIRILFSIYLSIHTLCMIPMMSLNTIRHTLKSRQLIIRFKRFNTPWAFQTWLKEIINAGFIQTPNVLTYFHGAPWIASSDCFLLPNTWSLGNRFENYLHYKGQKESNETNPEYNPEGLIN